MGNQKENALYLALRGKLEEASNLSELAEALIESGEFKAAEAYNLQVKKIQDEVKAAITLLESNS